MESSNLNQKQTDVPVINTTTEPKRRKAIGKWLTLVAIILVIGAGSMFVALRGDNSIVEAAPSATVQITSQGFDPKTVKIKKGESVTWENKDMYSRQIDADPSASGDSSDSPHKGELLATGESYTVPFEEAGTYSFHDRFDPVNYKVTVIVE